MGKIIKLRGKKPPYKTVCCSNCGGDTWRVIPEDNDGVIIQIKAIVCIECKSIIKVCTVEKARKLGIPTPAPLGDR